MWQVSRPVSWPPRCWVCAGNPVTDVAELVVRLTPGKVAEDAIQLVGHRDKPLLVTGVLVILLLLFAAFGVLARRSPGGAVGGFVTLGVIGLIAQQSQYGAPVSGILPIVVGLFTWLGCLAVLTAQLRPQPFRDADPQRRSSCSRRPGSAWAASRSALWAEGRRPPPGRRCRPPRPCG